MTNKPESVETPYGTFTVGDKFRLAYGSDYVIEIVDVTDRREMEDVIIRDHEGILRHIDWFKFSYRYIRC